jgi:hypothetical protein
MSELYQKYQNWCKTHKLQPFASKQFSQTVKAEIEMAFGLKYRHDLVGENGRAMRGWRGLDVVEAGEGQT